MFSWRTDPGPKGLSSWEGGRLQLHLRKTFITAEAAQQLSGLPGEVVTASVQGGRVTQVEGAPAFVKRLDWMNLRSLSILRL